MRTIAVLGASGFIGSRVVEMLHLGRLAQVRPVVRAPSSAACLSRFALDCQVADVRDDQSLAVAFSGCDVVVHAVAGSPALILGAVAPVYRAAQAARVRRLIYLSSASVHGQAPAPGTDEASPLSDRQALPYNNAKVGAERILRRSRDGGAVEIVILRPGIVVGPRSFWIGSFADALLAGQAFLVGDGRGICNSIYVDNLVHAIHAAATTRGVDGEAFLLGDQEKVTWADLYRPIAEALGFDLDRVTRLEPRYAEEPPSRLEMARRSPRVRAAFSLLPAAVQKAIVSSIRRSATDRSPWSSPPPPPTPRATVEMSLLQTCRYKLPHDKARRLLGYEPAVSFREGCARTVAWMGFAGYPITRRAEDGVAGLRHGDPGPDESTRL